MDQPKQRIVKQVRGYGKRARVKYALEEQDSNLRGWLQLVPPRTDLNAVRQIAKVFYRIDTTGLPIEEVRI